MIEDCDLSSTILMQLSGGAGIMLYAPCDTGRSLPFKGKFACSKNKTKYEALLIGLIFSL